MSDEKSLKRWINSKIDSAVINLRTDLLNGIILVKLINKIVEESPAFTTIKQGSEQAKYIIQPVYPKPTFRVQMIENVSDALEFLKIILQINITNISAADIVEGNIKLILGLLWSLSLYSTSSALTKVLSNECNSFHKVKKILMDWINAISRKRHAILEVSNFDRHWSLENSRPDLILASVLEHYLGKKLGFINYSDLERNGRKVQNLSKVFEVARMLGIPQLVDVEDFVRFVPDERCIILYLVEWFKVFEMEDDEEIEELSIRTSTSAGSESVDIPFILMDDNNTKRRSRAFKMVEAAHKNNYNKDKALPKLPQEASLPKRKPPPRIKHPKQTFQEKSEVIDIIPDRSEKRSTRTEKKQRKLKKSKITKTDATSRSSTTQQESPARIITQVQQVRVLPARQERTAELPSEEPEFVHSTLEPIKLDFTELPSVTEKLEPGRTEVNMRPNPARATQRTEPPSNYKLLDPVLPKEKPQSTDLLDLILAKENLPTTSQIDSTIFLNPKLLDPAVTKKLKESDKLLDPALVKDDLQPLKAPIPTPEAPPQVKAVSERVQKIDSSQQKKTPKNTKEPDSALPQQNFEIVKLLDLASTPNETKSSTSAPLEIFEFETFDVGKPTNVGTSVVEKRTAGKLEKEPSFDHKPQGVTEMKPAQFKQYIKAPLFKVRRKDLPIPRLMPHFQGQVLPTSIQEQKSSVESMTPEDQTSMVHSNTEVLDISSNEQSSTALPTAKRTETILKDKEPNLVAIEEEKELLSQATEKDNQGSLITNQMLSDIQSDLPQPAIKTPEGKDSEILGKPTENITFDSKGAAVEDNYTSSSIGEESTLETNQTMTSNQSLALKSEKEELAKNYYESKSPTKAEVPGESNLPVAETGKRSIGVKAIVPVHDKTEDSKLLIHRVTENRFAQTQVKVPEPAQKQQPSKKANFAKLIEKFEVADQAPIMPSRPMNLFRPVELKKVFKKVELANQPPIEEKRAEHKASSLVSPTLQSVRSKEKSKQIEKPIALIVKESGTAQNKPNEALLNKPKENELAKSVSKSEAISTENNVLTKLSQHKSNKEEVIYPLLKVTDSSLDHISTSFVVESTQTEGDIGVKSILAPSIEEEEQVKSTAMPKVTPKTADSVVEAIAAKLKEVKIALSTDMINKASSSNGTADPIVESGHTVLVPTRDSAEEALLSRDLDHRSQIEVSVTENNATKSTELDVNEVVPSIESKTTAPTKADSDEVLLSRDLDDKSEILVTEPNSNRSTELDLDEDAKSEAQSKDDSNHSNQATIPLTKDGADEVLVSKYRDEVSEILAPDLKPSNSELNVNEDVPSIVQSNDGSDQTTNSVINDCSEEPDSNVTKSTKADLNEDEPIIDQSNSTTEEIAPSTDLHFDPEMLVPDTNVSKSNEADLNEDIPSSDLSKLESEILCSSPESDSTGQRRQQMISINESGIAPETLKEFEQAELDHVKIIARLDHLKRAEESKQVDLASKKMNIAPAKFLLNLNEIEAPEVVEAVEVIKTEKEAKPLKPLRLVRKPWSPIKAERLDARKQYTQFDAKYIVESVREIERLQQLIEEVKKVERVEHLKAITGEGNEKVALKRTDTPDEIKIARADLIAAIGAGELEETRDIKSEVCTSGNAATINSTEADGLVDDSGIPDIKLHSSSNVDFSTLNVHSSSLARETVKSEQLKELLKKVEQHKKLAHFSSDDLSSTISVRNDIVECVQTSSDECAYLIEEIVSNDESHNENDIDDSTDEAVGHFEDEYLDALSNVEEEDFRTDDDLQDIYDRSGITDDGSEFSLIETYENEFAEEEDLNAESEFEKEDKSAFAKEEKENNEILTSSAVHDVFNDLTLKNDIRKSDSGEYKLSGPPKMVDTEVSDLHEFEIPEKNAGVADVNAGSDAFDLPIFKKNVTEILKEKNDVPKLNRQDKELDGFDVNKLEPPVVENEEIEPAAAIENSELHSTEKNDLRMPKEKVDEIRELTPIEELNSNEEDEVEAGVERVKDAKHTIPEPPIAYEKVETSVPEMHVEELESPLPVEEIAQEKKSVITSLVKTLVPATPVEENSTESRDMTNGVVEKAKPEPPVTPAKKSKKKKNPKKLTNLAKSIKLRKSDKTINSLVSPTESLATIDFDRPQAGRTNSSPRIYVPVSKQLPQIPSAQAASSSDAIHGVIIEQVVHAQSSPSKPRIICSLPNKLESTDQHPLPSPRSLSLKSASVDTLTNLHESSSELTVKSPPLTQPVNKLSKPFSNIISTVNRELRQRLIPNGYGHLLEPQTPVTATSTSSTSSFHDPPSPPVELLCKPIRGKNSYNYGFSQLQMKSNSLAYTISRHSQEISTLVPSFNQDAIRTIIQQLKECFEVVSRSNEEDETTLISFDKSIDLLKQLQESLIRFDCNKAIIRKDLELAMDIRGLEFRLLEFVTAMDPSPHSSSTTTPESTAVLVSPASITSTSPDWVSELALLIEIEEEFSMKALIAICNLASEFIEVEERVAEMIEKLPANSSRVAYKAKFELLSGALETLEDYFDSMEVDKFISDLKCKMEKGKTGLQSRSILPASFRMKSQDNSFRLELSKSFSDFSIYNSDASASSSLFEIH